MKTIELRLLQLILSPVSGDRVTLAMLHWDGTRLRVASSLAGLAALDPEDREGIRIGVSDIVRTAEKTSRQQTKAHEPGLGLGLAHLFPVREGFGAALYWTPITKLDTEDADAHFAALVHELRLDRRAPSRAKRVTSKAIHARLAAVGEQLRAEGLAAARLSTDFDVHNKLSYRPPLSWKNGRWHHAVPFSFDGLDREQMDREVQRLYGLVELSFPVGHVPVIVTAFPSQGETAVEAAREADILRASLATHDVEIVVPERADTALDLDSFTARVRRDLGTVH